MAQKRRYKKKNSETDRAIFVASAVIACIVIVLLIAAVIVFKHVNDKIGDGSGTVDGSGAGTDPGTVSSDAPSTESGEATGGETDATPPETEGDSEAPPESTESRPDETTDEVDKNVAFDTEKKTLDKDGARVVMIYPTVTDVGSYPYDAAKLNSLIRGYMDDMRDAMCADAWDDEYEYVIEKTEIKYADNAFLSAVVIGRFYITDAVHPTEFAYAVNCDLAGAKILAPDELIHDFAKVRSAFTGGKFKLAKGIDGLLKETNYEDMIMRYRPEYDIYPEVYYTKGGFGISIELVYTLGGYALFEIPISALGGAVYKPGK